jgi:hypothetical protein
MQQILTETCWNISWIRVFYVFNGRPHLQFLMKRELTKGEDKIKIIFILLGVVG